MRDGKVAEIGSHDELMAIEGGVYKQLVLLQTAVEQSEGELKGDMSEAEKGEHYFFEFSRLFFIKYFTLH